LLSIEFLMFGESATRTTSVYHFIQRGQQRSRRSGKLAVIVDTHSPVRCEHLQDGRENAAETLPQMKDFVCAPPTLTTGAPAVTDGLARGCVPGILRSGMPQFLAALLIALAGFFYAQVSLAAACASIATGNWNAQTTWGPGGTGCAGAPGGIPGAADSVTISNNNTVTVNVASQAGSVTIAAGGNASSLTLAAALNVTNASGGTGDITINGPSAAVTKQVSVGAQTLTVSRDVIINGGTTTNNAANISQLAVTTGTATIGRNLVITASTTVTSVARATLTTGKISVAGIATLTGGATATRDALLTVSAAPAVAGNGINITGDLDVNATVASSATVSITAANGVINVGGNVTNDDTVTVGAGIFTVTGDYTNDDTAIVAATTVSTGQLNITGNLTNGNTGTNTGIDTITLSSTGSITVGGTLTNNTGTTNGTITTSTTGTINANGDFINSGTFTHTAGGFLNVRGTNVTMNGTFNRGTGTVTSNKTTAGTQNLSGTALAFSNFVMNSANGITLGANATVNTLLTLTSGVITTTSAFNVIAVPACATPSVSRTSGHVNGNLRKAIPANASVCTFEVGGASAYTPITATFIAGALASNITAESADGDHASIATSGLDPSLTVNRFWSLTSTAAEATAFSAVFTFVAGDLDTDTAPTTAAFVGKRFRAAAWSTPTTGTRNALNTQLTGLTLLAATQDDYVFGETIQAAGSGSFNVVENGGNATTGKIFTKLAGTAFALDLIALNNARTAIDTTFKGAVIVDLLDTSDNTGALNATTGCRPVGAGAGNWHVIQTLTPNPQFLVADLGRKQNVSFTEANAWPDARVRITYPTSGTVLLTGCSNDNFSIRPLNFTSVTSNMTNTTTSSTPKAIAGSGTFDLTAATGLTGYTGTPKIDNTANTAVQAHAGAIAPGSVSGTFPAAVSGTSTGTGAFTYSEVGNFNLRGYAAAVGSTTARGVYDDTFTAVDGSADCTADFSNALSGGKYGCKFGLTADTSFFGRFYPANFVLTLGTITNRRVLACAPASTFSYAGEQFRVTFTLTAKNGAGSPATTQNYDPGAGFASFDATTIANLSFGAIDQADATPPIAATALTSRLTLGTSSGAWGSGSVAVTADMMVSRAASPDGPFESFNVGVDPIDADGVKLGSYNLDTSVPADTADRGLAGTSKIRFGRLRLQNAIGSELADLPIPMTAQYWDSTKFITNPDDSCTSLTAANLTLGAYKGGITSTNLAAPGHISLGAFSSGVGSLKLTKPSPVPTSTGSATVTVDLSAEAKTYLLGNWGVPTYTVNPSARAGFGLFSSQPRNFIFYRENY
jgi:hypothetical protein